MLLRRQLGGGMLLLLLFVGLHLQGLLDHTIGANRPDSIGNSSPRSRCALRVLAAPPAGCGTSRGSRASSFLISRPRKVAPRSIGARNSSPTKAETGAAEVHVPQPAGQPQMVGLPVNRHHGAVIGQQGSGVPTFHLVFQQPA